MPVSGWLWCTPSSVLGLKMCHGASSTFQLNGGEDTQAWLVLKAHQHQAQPSCCVPIQNTCCSKIRLITFARHYWRWTWWWLGHPGHEMLWEGTTPSKNLSVRQRGAGDILSPLQLMAKVLLSSKGSGFHPPCISCWHWAKLRDAELPDCWFAFSYLLSLTPFNISWLYSDAQSYWLQ